MIQERPTSDARASAITEITSRPCWTRWAWDTFASDPTCKLVMLALADVADENGMTTISQAELSEKTGYTTRTLQNAMKNLITNGFISRTPRYLKGGHRLSDLTQIQPRRRK